MPTQGFHDTIRPAVAALRARLINGLSAAVGYVTADTARLASATVVFGIVLGFLLGVAVERTSTGGPTTTAAITYTASSEAGPDPVHPIAVSAPLSLAAKPMADPQIRLDRPTGTATTREPVLAAIPSDPPAGDVRPRIAIVLDDVGINKSLAARAIDLDPAVTLAFLPYADGIEAVVETARARGHEILLHMPMEPMDGAADPGPNALLTSLDQTELAARFASALERVPSPVGFNNHMGSKMTASRPHMTAVMAAAKRHDLLFLDSRTTSDTVAETVAAEHGLAHAARDVFLDNDRAPDKIAAQLETAERIAQRTGQAIAIGHPYPETLDQLAAWIDDARMRGFDLVPISVLAKPPSPIAITRDSG